MQKTFWASRRAVLGGVAIASLAPFAARAANTADAKLLALGREFDDVAAQIDHGINHGSDISWEVLHRLEKMLPEIEATQASTIEGLCVKARAACWALLGDLDAPDQATSDERMALSIFRDLIRFYDPSLEQPGAMKALVEDNTNSASHSITRQPTD